MSLSPTEFVHWLQAAPARGATLAFIDQLARALFGLELATLAIMALVHARAFIAPAKAAPCASRS
ncbi:MAG TPA: hypothetical protein VGI30_06885 [Caulobacteraceae bacterium]|jgi:hypothetical protein